jgi:tetratricopeptide (TPR) repeat protein
MCFFRESKAIAELIGDVAHLGFIEHEMALIDQLAGSYAEALRRYRRCLLFDRSTGQQDFKSETFLQIGVTLLDAGRVQPARWWLLRSLRDLRKRKDHEILAEAMAQLARCYLGDNNPEKAEKIAIRAEPLATESRVPRSIAWVEFILGWARSRLGIANAKLHLGRALEQCTHAGLRAVEMELFYLLVAEDLEAEAPSLDLVAIRRAVADRYWILGNKERSYVLSDANQLPPSPEAA